jgi:hypothetical protein
MGAGISTVLATTGDDRPAARTQANVRNRLICSLDVCFKDANEILRVESQSMHLSATLSRDGTNELRPA